MRLAGLASQALKLGVVMSFRLHSILVSSPTPATLAAFWGQMLALEVFEGEQCWFLELPPNATRMVFRLARAHETGNISLELTAAPGKRLREWVDELITKGAVLVLDRRAPLAGWATLADPDGNEFLALASEEELREAFAMVQE